MAQERKQLVDICENSKITNEELERIISSIFDENKEDFKKQFTDWLLNGEVQIQLNAKNQL